MISASPKHRIFLAIAPIDFRKGIHGISTICRAQLQQDPLSGHYFIFRNKRMTDIKMLYYDTQGFCLFQKRLSAGKFNAWPRENTPLVTLTPAQLHVLIDNGDPKAVMTAAPWRSISGS